MTSAGKGQDLGGELVLLAMLHQQCRVQDVVRDHGGIACQGLLARNSACRVHNMRRCGCHFSIVLCHGVYTLTPHRKARKMALHIRRDPGSKKSLAWNRLDCCCCMTSREGRQAMRGARCVE